MYRCVLNQLTMNLSTSKVNALGHNRTSFLIDDILTRKSPSSSSRPGVSSREFLLKPAVDGLQSEAHSIQQRVFNAAALLGAQPTSIEHGQLLTSTTTTLQRHLQAAAFYASTVATPSSFDRNVSGSMPTGRLSSRLYCFLPVDEHFTYQL